MMLNDQVYSERNVGARYWILNRMIVGLVKRIDIQKQAAALTANRFVVGQLDAPNSLFVDINEPENVSRASSADIKTLHLIDKPKPRQPELFNLCNLLVVEFALYRDGSAPGCEPFVQIVAINVQKLRKSVCHCAGITYVRGRRIKRFHRNRPSEFVAVAVVDYAPHRTQVDRGLLLLSGAGN